MPEDNPEIAQEITEYLDYYCNAANKFDFTIMLKGPWGAGKTNFINKYIERGNCSDNPDRFMYLSLYGVTATSQVDDEIFRQLHPLLASKTVKFGTQIMKGLLRGAVKIDLDQHDHASIAMQTPSIELKEFLKRTTDRVLIFDDLERCSMKIADVLGYINAFLEHQAQKVIIIANEDELIERENNSKKSGKEVIETRYSDIKDKIVGRTLEIRSSVSSVLPEFISSVRDDKVRTLLDSSRKDIEAIFLQSERHNFRLLKQALWDFEFLSNSFEKHHWTRHDVLHTIMLVLVALSFECRSGRLNRENFSEFGLNWLARATRQNKGEETILDETQSRYPGVDFEQTFIGTSELATLLFEGRVEARAIRANLNRSAAFAERALEPAWKRITDMFSTDPKDFDSAVSELERQFSNRELIIPGEMFHMFGIRLFLSDLGVIKEGKETIVNQCRTYIVDLKESNRLPDIFHDKTEDIWMMNAYGRYQFTNATTAEFQAIKEFYSKAIFDAAMEGLPEHGKSLMELLNKNAIGFSRQLFLNAYEQSPYHNVPILATIEPEQFTNTILALPPEPQRIVFSALKARYERGGLENELSSEGPWLQTVRKLLLQKVENEHPIIAFRIKSFIRHSVDPTLNKSLRKDDPETIET